MKKISEWHMWSIVMAGLSRGRWEVLNNWKLKQKKKRWCTVVSEYKGKKKKLAANPRLPAHATFLYCK